MPLESHRENPKSVLKSCAVLSQFSWTKPVSMSIIEREQRCRKRQQKQDVKPSLTNCSKMNMNCSKNEVLSGVYFDDILVNDVIVYFSTEEIGIDCEFTQNLLYSDAAVDTCNSYYIKYCILY